MNNKGSSKLAITLLIVSLIIIIFAVYYFYTKQKPPQVYGGCDLFGLCF